MQGQRRVRPTTAAFAVVCAAAVLLGVSPAVSAAPAAPAAPERAAVLPESGQLKAQPANTRWAMQILNRYTDGNSSSDPTVLGSALGHTTSAAVPIRAALLQKVQVDPKVKDHYQQTLDRPADPSGLAYWQRRISDGRLTYENLVVTLSISNEAWNRAGANPADYTTWIYLHVLGRAPDPSGKAYWEGRLAAGTSRDRFVRSFLRSAERARRIVRANYEDLLRRTADSSGLNSWVSKYTAAKVGELDLAVSLLASNESRGDGCGYDPENCLLPFPSDRQAVNDQSTITGRRVALKPEWMPANASGKHVNPVEWNRNDGFSPGQSLIVRVPGIDLAQTGIAGIGDIESSLDADAPIVIWDNMSKTKVPYFAELDANAAAGSADQVLYIRPAVNYQPGHNYTVGLKGMKNAAGALLPSPAAFDRERDWMLAEDDEALWPGDRADIVPMTFDLYNLHQLGMAIQDVYLAWNFTVASTANTTERMLHIRDDALASLGAAAPAFTVDTVTPNPRDGVLKRIQGTFQVPLYLTGAGQPGQGFKTGSDGLPVRNGSFTAKYDCEIPTTATTTPSRATIYGHGLFGGLGEVRSGPQAAMVANKGLTYCATDWIGMAEEDIGNALTILNDLSTFNTLPDRSQQGILNTVFLGRLLTDDDGFVSNEWFRNGSDPLIDTSDLFYDGNSQGAVIGGAFVAVDPKVSAGVLGVAGMNYSTLLDRSVDFDPFNQLMVTTYPDRVDQVVSLQLLQMLWDRGETNGYAAHLNGDRNLRGTPDKRVLIHVALGDHQVSTVTAEIEARTAGIPIHRPTYLTDRDPWGDDAWGLPAIDYGTSSSGLIVWDSGAALPPQGNVPPRTGEDPHGDPRNSADSQQQKDQFLRTGGTLIDVCAGAPCEAPAT